MCGFYTSQYRARGGQKRSRCPLELKLQAALSLLLWVLETELQSLVPLPAELALQPLDSELNGLLEGVRNMGVGA